MPPLRTHRKVLNRRESDELPSGRADHTYHKKDVPTIDRYPYVGEAVLVLESRERLASFAQQDFEH
jgi:hypothetical protein